MVNHRLVLLFGMPRSGTTWLGKIFDSHPNTLYRHEPDSWGRLNALPLFPDASDAGTYREVVEAFVDRLPSMRDVKVSATLPVFKKQFYSLSDQLFQRLSIRASKAAAKFLGEFPVPLPRPKGDPVLVWKSIESIGRLGAISAIIPVARAVQILRHPCGYVASVKRGEQKGKFSDRMQSSEDYGVFEQLVKTPQAVRRGLTLDGLRELTPVERLAWRWLLYNEKAMDDIASNENCMTIRYEDVCADPEAGTKKMFAFANLDWNEQSASFVGASTSSQRDSYYSVFKDPLKAANKWQTELSSEEIQQILSVVESSAPGQCYMQDER